MELKWWNTFQTTRHCRISLSAVLALGLLVSTLAAQAATTNMPNPAAKPVGTTPSGQPTPSQKQMDTKVLSQMHAINLMEIKVGTLARERGKSKEVRAYGNRLENDHQLADRLVKNLAARENIILQPPPPHKQQETAAMEKNLEHLHGTEFDKTFLDDEIHGHTEAIQKLMRAYGQLRDPRVHRLVGKLIPILGQHLQLAKDIKNKNVKG